MQMQSHSGINLLLHENSSILCSLKLAEKSEVLRDLICFTDDENEPIPMPAFVTKTKICDIMHMLESDSISFMEKSKLQYLLEILKILDFLAITELFNDALSFIHQQVTCDKCFEIFQMTFKSTIPCFNEIQQRSCNVMMDQLIAYYESNYLQEDIQDPYVAKYVMMTFNQIKLIINIKKENSTIMKIILFKNWWQKNKIFHLKDDITEILSSINEEACYIPRSKIIFMRKIRDQILLEIEPH